MPGTPIEAVTAASIITLVQGIERVGSAAPAAIAFKGALRRKGQEAQATGGSDAVAALLWQVAQADAVQAEARMAILREAWSGLPGWRS